MTLRILFLLIRVTRPNTSDDKKLIDEVIEKKCNWKEMERKVLPDDMKPFLLDLINRVTIINGKRPTAKQLGELFGITRDNMGQKLLKYDIRLSELR